MASITISRLNKHYGRTHVLKDLDLSIEDGEFSLFLGLPAAASPPCCSASRGWKAASMGLSGSMARRLRILVRESATSRWCSRIMRFTRTVMCG